MGEALVKPQTFAVKQTKVFANPLESNLMSCSLWRGGCQILYFQKNEARFIFLKKSLPACIF